ncbi:hypothetical protein R3P38DRAFT_2799735 [Favolaschia claudopus]|uniref:Uncharacterized protein n=1 Tax=Favolaschia claudopus TaxID=2862362 RepID=A0AAV9ZZ28_9AGAR
MYGIMGHSRFFAIIFYGSAIQFLTQNICTCIRTQWRGKDSMRSRFSRSFNHQLNSRSGCHELPIHIENRLGGSGGSGGRGGQHGGLGGTGQGPQIHVFGVNTWNVNMQGGATPDLFAHPSQQTPPLPNSESSIPPREQAAENSIPHPSFHSSPEIVQLREEMTRRAEGVDARFSEISAVLRDLAVQLGTRAGPTLITPWPFPFHKTYKAPKRVTAKAGLEE